MCAHLELLKKLSSLGSTVGVTGGVFDRVDRVAPRIRSAAARQTPRPLGPGGFTWNAVAEIGFSPR